VDTRKKEEKIYSALEKFEYKKALNIIEDKAPVRIIDAHVIGLFKSKYPHDPNIVKPTPRGGSFFVPNRSELRKVVRKKKASKHGVSGLAFGELKAVSKNEALEINLSDLVTLILNG
jgi:hypothetical protein